MNWKKKEPVLICCQRGSLGAGNRYEGAIEGDARHHGERTQERLNLRIPQSKEETFLPYRSPWEIQPLGGLALSVQLRATRLEAWGQSAVITGLAAPVQS